MRYLVFFIYLIRHKWFVLIKCCRLGIPWQGLIHDISKFLPEEYVAYATCYQQRKTLCALDTITPEEQHSIAWLIHQKRNRHHWQWWILYGENPHPTLVPMPDKYIKEMVADWWGAGMAQGQPDIVAWYQSNKNKILLHPSTRAKVEELLDFDSGLDTLKEAHSNEKDLSFEVACKAI